MFDNTALNVAVGLIFIYLLYSLLASIILEFVSALVNLRAVLLVSALTVMLNDREKLDLSGKNQFEAFVARLAQHVRFSWRSLWCRFDANTLAYVFFSHPNIKYLSKSSLRSKPSYIEAANFSATLVQILRGAHYDGSRPQIEQIRQTLYPDPGKPAQVSVGLNAGSAATADIQPETLDRLRQLFVDAQNDVERFKTLLEAWFNEMMARTTGWYKRRTNCILLSIGLFIAAWGNVDTIKIYKLLARDKKAREELVAMATKTAPQLRGAATADSAITAEAYAQVTSAIEQSGQIFGIGVNSHEDYARLAKLTKAAALLRRERMQQPLRQAKALKVLTDSLRNAAGADSARLALRIETHRQRAALEADVLNKTALYYHDAVLKQQAAIEFRDVTWGSSLGWLITAMAISLGSTFWFDMLNKLVNLRAAGQKPDDTAAVPATAANKATIPANQRIG